MNVEIPSVENQQPPTENPTRVPPESGAPVPPQTDTQGTVGEQSPAGTSETPKVGEGTTDQRIRDLQSHWHKADAERVKTASELEEARAEIARLKNPTDTVPDWLKPDWQPKTVEDIQSAMKSAMDLGAKNALAQIESTRHSEESQMKEAQEMVVRFTESVKQVDPTFDLNDFNQFLKETGFEPETEKDLRNGYLVYVKHIALAAKAAQTPPPAQPINKPGGAPQAQKTVDYSTISQARNAQELIANLRRN
jgi:hypothetical protein